MNKSKLIVSFLLGALAPVLAVYLYSALGFMPVTTSDAPMPFEKWIAKSAIRRAVHKEASLKPPNPITETQLKSATRVYINHCAGCHGLINSPDSKMAEAMFPRAPQLFKTDDLVTDDPVGAIYWKIKNGIRLTGMPAFKDILTVDEMWAISTLLQQADKMSVDVKNELTLTLGAKKK